MWDVEGRRYLDFSAGIAVNSLGGGDGGVLKVGDVVFFWETLCSVIFVGRIQPFCSIHPLLPALSESDFLVSLY